MRKYKPQTHPVIAIDFDGTIVQDKFPNIGELNPNAIETINAMVEDGYEIIIWTARGDLFLLNARDFLLENGLIINPEKGKRIKFNQHADYMLERYDTQGIKIGASFYIDDKGYGAPDFKTHWSVIKKEFLG